MSDHTTFLKGSASQLDMLVRIQWSSSTSGSTSTTTGKELHLLQSALQQVLQMDESILLGPFPCRSIFVSLMDGTCIDETNEYDNKDGDDDDGGCMNHLQQQEQEYITGMVVVTDARILFWSPTHMERNLSIPATYIDLHARMTDDGNEDYDNFDDDNNNNNNDTSDGNNAIYLQLHDDSDEMIEWTIIPDPGGCIDGEQVFTALSQLMAMNPVDENSNGEGDDDNNVDDEMIVAPPRHAPIPTEEQRQAMLDHLDQLLVVPPEYEVHQQEQPTIELSHYGQFDDADEDDFL